MLRHINRKVWIIFISILFISPISILNFIAIDYEQVSEDIQEDINLKDSDVAGTDLYAEKINAYVAGNQSVIKQSLFTNDTNILPNFDIRDPAFYKCNFLISASNGITPKIFPRILNENGFSNQYSVSFNGFSGFLYYDEILSEQEAKLRASRALEIIKRKFAIDLIMINVSNPNFFPFVGYYPDWALFFKEVTENLPMDGYWKALDLNRLTSKEYLLNYHISSTIFTLNSFDFFEKDILASIKQVNFNLDSLDLSFVYSLEIENLFEQLTDLIVDYGSIYGNISQIIGNNQTVTQEDFEQFSTFFDMLSLSNKSQYTSLMIQYEGNERAIKKVGKNQYEFNLWDALNYNGISLRPSEKIFIALIGAFMSEININILCTDIIDVTPKYFSLYEFLLEQVETLLFYAGVDFDLDLVRDYSFNLFWVDQGGIKQSYIKPVNLNDDTDFINFLPVLGFQGLPGIPTGIFNPVKDFRVKYLTNTSDSNMVIKKELLNDNSSFGVSKDFSFNITAQNLSNHSVWGVKTSFPLNLGDIFTFLAGPFSEDLMDDMWEIVKIEYPNQYNSLEDFFNFDEDPRIFYFDSLGTGLIDMYYPNINNITNLWPYNNDADNVLDILFDSYPIYLTILNPGETKDLFTNENSIWNKNNWKLNPYQKISYIYSNLSIESFDSYTEFYRFNFTIKETPPVLPVMISGNSIMNTDPYMALLNDKDSWVIESEEQYVDQYDLELIFMFQNQTNIDLNNNSIERVSITINYTTPLNVISFEIFDYSIEEYIDMSPNLDSRENETSTFSYTNVNTTLNWMFDPYDQNNYTLIIRIKGMDSNPFNISINNFDVFFSYRDINEYKSSSSRVIYSSLAGNIQYIRRSNSVSLSTDNMSSIISFAYLNNYNLKAGEVNTYNLYFQNIGSATANEINVSILIPGIIKDGNKFTIRDNYLNYYLPSLAPFEKEEVNFTFYTPNSESIFNAIISYENPTFINNLNSSELSSRPNEVNIFAFIDYIDYFPFIHSLSISYNFSDSYPLIGDLFNLSINMKNVGRWDIPISQMNITLGDQFGDLIYKNPSPILSFNNVSFNSVKTIKFVLKKLDWKGYFCPSINFITNKDYRLFQIARSSPIILGNISLFIYKTISKNQMESGEVVNVEVKVRNIGNICIKNLTLSDVLSFNQIYFDLVEGSLIKKISCLKPNETLSMLYKVKAKSQSIITLKAASIEYYFLRKSIVISNEIDVKVIIPKIIQMNFVLIPLIVSLVVLVISSWQVSSQRSKRLELRRLEASILRASPRDSIIKIKGSLKEEFDKIGQREERK
ncbi:MAG: hypothetical protein ACFFBH_00370 [Promethearchaeota archaeon]